MRIRFYDLDGKYMDEFYSKDEFINLGSKDTICVLHSVIYRIEKVSPFTKTLDENKQKYIRVTATLIG